MRTVLKRLKNAGFTFDPDKLEFGVIKVKYFRFIIKAGVSVNTDPEKTTAI